MAEPRVRLDRLLPVLVAAIAAAVALWASRPYAVGVFHDDGVYVILGKSIATGQGYRSLHLPGAPAATHYPPVYPLLLALLWKIAPRFPENVPTFLFANAMLLAATAVGVLAFARTVLGWSRREAAAVALIATLSTPLLMLSSLVLSEPLFAALLFPTLIAAERVARDESTTRTAVLVAIALGVLALVRTHAIALSVALLFVLVLRRRWRTALLCAAVTGATLAPWQVWVALHAEVGGSLSGSYGTYSAWLVNGARDGGAAFVLQTVAVNLREVGADLADHFALADSLSARNAAAVLALLLVCVGVWRAVRRAPVLVAFVIVYVGILLAWPFTPWRFVYAIWPVVILFAGEAVMFALELRRASIHASSRSAAPRVAIVLCAVIVCVGAAREETRAYMRRSWAQPGADAKAQIAPLLRWVVTRTNVNDILAVDGEPLVYLFTGRRAVPIVPFTAAEYLHARTVGENAESLRRSIQDIPIDYVATVSPNHRLSGEMLAASSAAANSLGAARLVPLAPLAAGETFRVDRIPPSRR